MTIHFIIEIKNIINTIKWKIFILILEEFDTIAKIKIHFI